jgi:cytochrome P450
VPYPSKKAEMHYRGLPEVHIGTSLGLSVADVLRLLSGHSSESTDEKISVSSIMQKLHQAAAAGDGTSVGLTAGTAIVYTDDPRVAFALFRANTSRVSDDDRGSGPMAWAERVVGKNVFTANGPLHLELLKILKDAVRNDSQLAELWPRFQQYAGEFVQTCYTGGTTDDFLRTLTLYSMRGFGMVAGFPLEDATFNATVPVVAQMMRAVVNPSKFVPYQIWGGGSRGADADAKRLANLLLGSPEQVRPILENPDPHLYGKAFLIPDAVYLLQETANLPENVAAAIEGHFDLEAYLQYLFNTGNTALSTDDQAHKGTLIDWLSQNLPGNISERTRQNLPGLVIAGHETTSLALFWLTVAFAQLPPTQQQQIIKELREGEVRGGDSLFTKRLEDSFPTFFRFFYETMRLHTIVPNLSRVANEAITITVGNRPMTVRKGDIIIFSSKAMHHNPDLFSKPDELNIDRPDSERAQVLPFGIMGARSCPGFRFSELEIVAYFQALSRAGIWPTIDTVPLSDDNTSHRPVMVTPARLVPVQV